jgi:hypothetical protein
MNGAIPLIPQYAFMAWCSVKTQEQLFVLVNIVTSTECIKELSCSMSIAVNLLITEMSGTLTFFRSK